MVPPMPEDDLSPAPRADDRLRKDEELPVVSRLVIEIRSDGTRTIARGAAEDPGGQVGLEVRADSPAELVVALTKLMLQLPGMMAGSIKSARERRGELPAAEPRGLAARVRRRLGLSR